MENINLVIIPSDFLLAYTFSLCVVVYITPEKAVTVKHQLKSLHETCGIALIAIDEAHCISEWGHNVNVKL